MATPHAKAAVAIPVYKTAHSRAEQLSIDRTIDVLGRHDLYFVGPRRLASHLHEQCRRYGPHVDVKTFDDAFFTGIPGYNALMRSKRFYGSFSPYSHLLIAQTDALVLSDQLASWCARDCSYIGAPWFKGGSEPKRPLEFMGVGNGGFSLRRIDHFMQVLTTPRRIPNFLKSRPQPQSKPTSFFRYLKHEWFFAYNAEPLFPTSNEDFFWGMLVPAVFPFFRVPEPQVALAFAFEAEPRTLFELNHQALPFGCHAWERCDRQFWEEKLPDLRTA